MTTALVCCSFGQDLPTVAQDLIAVGIGVLARVDCTDILQEVLKNSPDVVVIHEMHPDAALFDSIVAINASAARPIIVFTTDPDAEKIAQATRSGVHAYVVNGYSSNRLRSVVHLAQARFRSEQAIRKELAEVNQRFAERILVDRAKGILMGARQLREEEAYRALRSAAMQRMQRIGQVSQQVIDSARYAEAINRAGQLRMLSQRLVKLYAQACLGLRAAETAALFEAALAHVDSNLAHLSQNLSKATFGDLLEAVTGPWQALRKALAGKPNQAALPDIDSLADEVLKRAEQLTVNLEIAGYAAALHVINVAGRQRMLCQRVAKAGLIGTIVSGPEAARAQIALDRARLELEQGLTYLSCLPLTNADIARELAEANQVWARCAAALENLRDGSARNELAMLSDRLLDHFDQLTDEIERGVQALM